MPSLEALLLYLNKECEVRDLIVTFNVRTLDASVVRAEWRRRGVLSSVSAYCLSGVLGHVATSCGVALPSSDEQKAEGERINAAIARVERALGDESNLSLALCVATPEGYGHRAEWRRKDPEQLRKYGTESALRTVYGSSVELTLARVEHLEEAYTDAWIESRERGLWLPSVSEDVKLDRKTLVAVAQLLGVRLDDVGMQGGCRTCHELEAREFLRRVEKLIDDIDRAENP